MDETQDLFNEMKPKKKGKTGYIVTIVILILLLLGALGYIGYDKFYKQEEPKKEKEVEEKIEEHFSVLEVGEFLETIPYSKVDGVRLKDAYIGTTVTIDNIDHRLLLEYALNKCSENKEFDGNPETLNKIIKESYNIDDVKHQNFGLYKYKNGKYTHIASGNVNESSIFKKLVDYNVDNDKLIIEEKVGFMVRIVTGIDEDGAEKEGEVFVATRKYDKNYIAKVDIGGDGEYKVTPEEIFENNLNKFNTYKHTFKKASDGKYYWYSSEPLNE